MSTWTRTPAAQGNLAQPSFDRGLDARALGRLDEKAAAMPAADERQRRWRGAEDAYLAVARGGPTERAAGAVDGGFVAPRDDDPGQPAEGRHPVGLARPCLAGEETVPVSRDQGGHHGMLRIVGLDERMAGPGPSTGASRDLMQHLESCVPRRADLRHRARDRRRRRRPG